MTAASAKTAVVTGAAGGIGRALCEAFTADGYAVVATDTSEDPGVACDTYLQSDLEELCELDNTAGAPLVRQIVAALDGNGLQVLVNNAALQVLDSTAQLRPADFRRSLSVNVVAPFLLVQGLLNELERAQGSVVNIASVHAHATKPGFAAYATSKAALTGLTRALAVDLGGRVRVNSISPAATLTPMLRAGFAADPDKLEQLGAFHPAGRVATAEEIAHAAVFLAARKSGFVTGSELLVDGGILSRLHDPD